MTMGIFFRRAFSDLKLRLGTQLMTTLVVCLSILIFSFFALLYFNLEHFIERFGSELGIVIFLKENVPQDRIPSLYAKITRLDGVESVNYVSPEEAFKRLENYLRHEKEVLEGVNPRFLPPSFEIRIDRAVFNLDRIRSLAQELAQWPEVSKVQYGQEWINKLQVFASLTRNIVFISGLLLLLTAAFVVANTIKLTVYARQEELEILRLVGATNTFIEAPFLIEAFLQGLIGSTLAVAIVYACFKYLSEAVAASELLRGVTVSFFPWHYTFMIIGASVALCVFGTALAMRRFLRL